VATIGSAQGAEARFKAIVEAYAVLNDEEARKEYDAGRGRHAHGWESARPTPAWARAAQEASRGVRREWTRTHANPADFDFEEWNRMHFGPQNTHQARQQAEGDRFRARQRETASSTRQAHYAAQARTETDYHWRRLHRLRQARNLGRWAVPVQLAAFAGIGYGVYVTSKALVQ